MHPPRLCLATKPPRMQALCLFCSSCRRRTNSSNRPQLLSQLPYLRRSSRNYLSRSNIHATFARRTWHKATLSSSSWSSSTSSKAIRKFWPTFSELRQNMSIKGSMCFHRLSLSQMAEHLTSWNLYWKSSVPVSNTRHHFRSPNSLILIKRKMLSRWSQRRVSSSSTSWTMAWATKLSTTYQ